jgi:hypothetical protein
VAGKNRQKPHQRQPALAVRPKGNEPRLGERVDDVKTLRPVWRLGLMDMTGGWGWRNATPEDLHQVWARLKCFESMTWGEIERSPSCGSMGVEGICEGARERLVAISRDDIDTLYKLRVTSAGRIWGIRNQHVFELLWWDPGHTVYPMNLADN